MDETRVCTLRAYVAWMKRTADMQYTILLLTYRRIYTTYTIFNVMCVCCMMRVIRRDLAKKLKSVNWLRIGVSSRDGGMPSKVTNRCRVASVTYTFIAYWNSRHTLWHGSKYIHTTNTQIIKLKWVRCSIGKWSPMEVCLCGVNWGN